MLPQPKSILINLKPAAAIRSRSLLWPMTKWMLTPTPAGRTGAGISLAAQSRGHRETKAHQHDFMMASLAGSAPQSHAETGGLLLARSSVRWMGFWSELQRP